jgi:hypothetical protein
MIKSWLSSYKPGNKEEALQAMREIMQEVALAGLYRGGFFKEAAFYGGTALRIFHGLQRFSEDLDFSLLKVDETFKLENYFSAVEDEFKGLGININLDKKIKSQNTNVESAFLKSDTLSCEIILNNILPELDPKITKGIKIKIEVDTGPPDGFETEEKLLVRPFSFYVNCYSLSDLFAGKIHALLFRKWKNRVKGRDWFDFEWYVSNGIPLNLNHFHQRAIQSGHLEKTMLTETVFKAMMMEKFKHANIKSIITDISPFINNHSSIEHWTPQYFIDLLGLIKFK